MTHTPQGSIHDNLSGVGATVHEKYSYCGDSMSLYTHCGTHIDTLNHLGHWGCFWNGWTADKHLGSRHWTVGGTDKYPPIMARGVLLDVAGLHGVDCLDDGHAVTAAGAAGCGREAGRRATPGRRRLRAHGPHDEVAGLRRLPAGAARASTSPPPSGCARRPVRCASPATRSGSR